MPHLQLEYRSLGTIAQSLTNSELVARIRYEFPLLPQSLSVLLERFDAGIGNKDAMHKSCVAPYLAQE